MSVQWEMPEFHKKRAQMGEGFIICRWRGRLKFAWRRDKFCPAGQREFRSCAAREFLFAAQKQLSPQSFRIAGFIYPGSYLLSRDLSSDYHRRADVSLPGSEWDRVGPSGYDHQASALLRTSHLVLRTSACLAVICACGLCIVAGLLLGGSRLASAWLVLCVCCSPLTPITFVSSRNCLSPGWCIRSIGC